MGLVIAGGLVGLITLLVQKAVEAGTQRTRLRRRLDADMQLLATLRVQFGADDEDVTKLERQIRRGVRAYALDPRDVRFSKRVERGFGLVQVGASLCAAAAAALGVLLAGQELGSIDATTGVSSTTWTSALVPVSALSALAAASLMQSVVRRRSMAVRAQAAEERDRGSD